MSERIHTLKAAQATLCKHALVRGAPPVLPDCSSYPAHMPIRTDEQAINAVDLAAFASAL